MKNIRDGFSPELQAALKGQPAAPLDEPTFACADCRDTGWYVLDLPVNHPQFGKPQACQSCEKGIALQEKQWNNRLQNAALPEMYQTFTFETWDALLEAEKEGKWLAYWCARLFVEREDHNVNLAQAYQLAGRALAYHVWHKSLVFQGPWGVGKTGLAAAIINALIAGGQSVLYIRTQDFLESVKARFGKDEPSVEDVMQTVKRASVLVMDEFNLTASGDWRQETMENIMRYRYGNNLPTVVTCNATKDELTAQWGARTTHVLFAMAHWIPMGGVVLRDLRSMEGKAF